MTFKARIPLAAFRVPDGKIAVTLDLHGTDCMTAVIDIDSLDQMLGAFEAMAELDESDRSDWSAHVQLREALEENLRQGETLNACVAAGLWLALNHPVGGTKVRTQVATSMRIQNRAQVTVTSDDCQRWCFVVSERPAMPEKIMAMTPIGLMVCMTFPERAETPREH